MQRRWYGFFVAGLALAFTSVGRADDAAARAAVEKGLKALGGAEKVEKFKAATFKLKGTFHGMGMAIPYTGTWTGDGARIHFTIEIDAGGQKIEFTRVFDGAKGWIKVMGMTVEMNADQVAEAKHELYAQGVLILWPLLKDKEFTLTPLGETEVEKRPAVGVKVASKGQRDINLYFDKESGLPVKSETTVKEEETGKEVNQDEYFSDYKEIEGVKHAMKIIIKREGKLYVDGEALEFKTLEKLDDGLFGKP